MREYMQMLIWIMLFVIVIEMIFPDSDYKKYLKLVLGCIVIYTMIKPIIRYIPVQGTSYNDYVREYQQKLEEGLKDEALLNSYNEQVYTQQAFLKESTALSIQSLLEKELDIKIMQVDIEWIQASEVQIDKLYLSVSEKKDQNLGTITIPMIQVGEKSKSIYADEEKLKNKIKTCLRNFYNVPSRNIYITVQKN